MNWLFLRGLAREQRHWGDFPKQFLAKNPNEKLYFLDLPGVGTEINTLCPLSIRATQSIVRERWLQLCSQENNENPWSILGISLGAMVALDWMGQYSNDFYSGIVCNLSASNFNSPFQRLRFKSLWSILSLLQERESVKIERKVLSLVSQCHSRDESIARRFSEYMIDPKQLRLTLFRQLIAAARFRAPKQMTGRILFLSSAQDKMVKPECTQTLANYYRAPLKINSIAGHDLFLDDPEWAIQEISHWIRKVNNRGVFKHAPLTPRRGVT